MILLVGLGNPGKEYEWTRHNIGYKTVDRIVELREGKWQTVKRHEAMIAKINIDQTEVVAVKPLTYMNLSGQAVTKLAHYYKVKSSDIVVISDDIDLDWGVARLRLNGTDGGHNGLKSIIQAIGEDFTRVRIGVGRNGIIPAENYVLKRLDPLEKEQLVQSVDNVADYLIKSNIDQLEEKTISIQIIVGPNSGV